MLLVQAIRSFNDHKCQVLYLAADLPYLAVAGAAFEMGKHRTCGSQVLRQKVLEWGMIINFFKHIWEEQA